LARESNTVAGTKVVLKYHEPPDSRKPPPSQQWRLYVFKGEDVVQTVMLYTRSCWLIGREAAVADILVEHPSTSGQHAVIQFRHKKKKKTVQAEFADETRLVDVVRPYLMDLESANGTELNGQRIEQARYVEIRDKDIVKIGGSEREYVFMLPPKE
jgi:smad nuclear-interacting protein 1